MRTQSVGQKPYTPQFMMALDITPKFKQAFPLEAGLIENSSLVKEAAKKGNFILDLFGGSAQILKKRLFGTKEEILAANNLSAETVSKTIANM